MDQVLHSFVLTYSVLDICESASGDSKVLSSSHVMVVKRVSDLMSCPEKVEYSHTAAAQCAYASDYLMC